MLNFYRIKKLPLWIEDTPQKTTLMQRFRARYLAPLAFFYAFVKEYQKQMIVYLAYDEESKRYFVDIPHGYEPRYESPYHKVVNEANRWNSFLQNYMTEKEFYQFTLTLQVESSIKSPLLMSVYF